MLLTFVSQLINTMETTLGIKTQVKKQTLGVWFVNNGDGKSISKSVLRHQ
ncbi:hypothetical protein HanRHA438_Chr03g0124071 [Helianthus annuus]|nr:hypothetical protein HanHA300_Chr03g0093431 [Helianthus annuus]KAJ0600905.1 hypothetical protein HanIR_Chr03g0122391 [Helianthus annuus]KAJ0608124.1 hypothetical protein HanHA89_Chr03g0105121 [Helianthus annuus]KAJ0768191.1 hypothetical protein HanLR1_Chr03g0098511 [Helianthus annuus]KAJ0935838.1 hypothetical protein HanRHA438_Chr03g0124071 [Helianthus annuus]